MACVCDVDGCGKPALRVSLDVRVDRPAPFEQVVLRGYGVQPELWERYPNTVVLDMCEHHRADLTKVLERFGFGAAK